MLVSVLSRTKQKQNGIKKTGGNTMAQKKNKTKNKTLQIVVRCIIAVLLCAVLYTAVFFVAV